MTTSTVKRTVAAIAAEMPRAAAVFEEFGIDYCCGGELSLEQACAKAHVSVEAVERELEAVGRENRSADSIDWRSVPLSQLVEHIVDFHHQYVRRTLGRLNQLFDQVMTAHGASHSELRPLLRFFHTVADGMVQHMLKEEQVLFPYILRLEEAALAQQPLPPAPFGRVENPVRVLKLEHDDVGAQMKAIRALTHDYVVVSTGCNSFRALYATLAEFERDLHQHVHLENNILFPRAQGLEESLRGAAKEGQ
ncbi:MAG: iron-sulfur cluster repair di-iron protein [Candidatus Koribacter versatilis]|uniref:Iron-sulfur cluster repair di-iron protein n=1 Tax=Candidatus Korobacter versatilis TaxID=658062 RepID=A0A932A6Q0_9BACT|nr:iron-sulfur cluster repair di-iron protein [Candidatus Koribacter versatilis]